nr:PREDICTED: rootletin [Struthio camelus australis]
MAGDMDPDHIQTALRDFLQELRDTQRERDDLRIQVMNLSRQLSETEQAQEQTHERILQLQKSLADSEEGKRGAAGRLSSMQLALRLQDEAIRRGERESQSFAERVVGLECSLQACRDKNRELERMLQAPR